MKKYILLTILCLISLSLNADFAYSEKTFLSVGLEPFLMKTNKVLIDAEKDQERENARLHFQMVKTGVDETGKIMILMYHRVGTNNSYYTRSIEDFKADLVRLYELGYRSVAYSDYISGEMDIPMGTTPVVLTFDDGDVSNFRYIETDSGVTIDPDCVVGILEEFALGHPDFGTNAIFFLNKDNPFGQSKYLDDKMAYLLSNGYEIGNHTLHHESLKDQNLDGIYHGIGENVVFYGERFPEFQMDNIALPFGERPKDENLYGAIFEGQFNGYEYTNKSALLVGWRPEKPLYTMENYTGFLNRVQCGDEKFQLGYWLDYFVDHPEERYMSDGKPGVITIPESKIGSYFGDLEKLEIYTLEIMGGQ